MIAFLAESATTPRVLQDLLLAFERLKLLAGAAVW